MTGDHPSPSGEGLSDQASPGSRRDASPGSGIDPDRAVTLAAIIGAHGVTGEVRLKLFGESLDSFRRFKAFAAAGRALTLKAVRHGPNGAVARFAEITDRNAAEALRGAELTVPRSALPPLEEGEFYHCDIIGLQCISSTNTEVGRVVAVENFGAGDILEIEKPNGKRFMVPIHAATLGETVRIDPAFLE